MKLRTFSVRADKSEKVLSIIYQRGRQYCIAVIT